MTGVIQGGWSYVIAAYALTATVLVAYAVSLFVRLGQEKRHDRH